MSDTRRRSAERFKRRNQLMTAKHRPRQFINTGFGHNMTRDHFLEPLAKFLAGGYEDNPDDPPYFLRPLVKGLDPRSLALAALAPLLDGISRGWDRDDPSAGMKLKLKVGEDLYRKVKTDGLRWSQAQRVQAGDWLLSQALTLDIFSYDEDGLPCIADKVDIAQLYRDAIAADPSFAPFLKPQSHRRATRERLRKAK
jgi:hypothetical protein